MVKRNLIPVILITSCMAVICFILLTYYQEDTEYEELKRRVITKETGQEKEKKNWLKIDWDALPKDCIAWIHFRHPKVISYPVMQGKDNGFYLHKNYKGEYSYSGSIFADSSNNPLFTDDNTIIYGHNMASGKMFGSLKKFRDEDYFKKNRKFTIYTRDGRRLVYRIYNAVLVRPSSKIYTYAFGSDETKAEYLTTWMGKGLFKTDYSVGIHDRIISLSTCQYSGSRRLVLQAKLIKEETR